MKPTAETYFEFLVDDFNDQKALIRAWKCFLKSEFVAQFSPEVIRNYEVVNVDVEHRLPRRPVKLWFVAPLNLQRLSSNTLKTKVFFYIRKIF